MYVGTSLFKLGQSTVDATLIGGEAW
jgi:hypothetical protein